MALFAGVPSVRRWLAGLAITALLAAGLLQGHIDARAADRPAVSPMLYLPSGKYLKVASLGFDELLADILYIWSIQYYGNYNIEDRYLYPGPIQYFGPPAVSDSRTLTLLLERGAKPE